MDHYRADTKYFYDKAYFVRKESVPGFFQGHEDDILQCGKYTMLLKAYKPHVSAYNKVLFLFSVNSNPLLTTTASTIRARLPAHNRVSHVCRNSASQEEVHQI